MRWTKLRLLCLIIFILSCLLLFKINSRPLTMKRAQSMWNENIKDTIGAVKAMDPQLLWKQAVGDETEEILKSDSSDIVNSTIFLYRAYLNNIGSQTRIRIFSLTRCHDNDTRISVDFGSSSIVLKLTPLESSCPWSWVKGCMYNAYVYDGIVPKDTEVGNKVTVSHDTEEVQAVLDIHRTVRNRDGKLTVCVPPLYWYTDWTKLIIFLEWWSNQGASHFIIYYHSATENVKITLEYYIKKGMITLVPWPLLPSNDEVDPNKSIYRLSHTLAHNDCAQRISTEFGSLVDIDEYLWVKNTTLLQYAKKEFSKNVNLGSISFKHHILVYEPPITPKDFGFDRLDYKGIAKASYFPVKNGPRKTVFRAASVVRLSTHWVMQFTAEKKWKAVYVPEKDGLLLHNRFNYLESNTKNNTKIEMLPPKELEKFRLSVVARKNEIFKSGAHFKTTTQIALDKCLAKWRSTQANCKVPVTGCHSTMLPLENWDHNKEDVYTLL